MSFMVNYVFRCFDVSLFIGSFHFFTLFWLVPSHVLVFSDLGARFVYLFMFSYVSYIFLIGSTLLYRCYLWYVSLLCSTLPVPIRPYVHLLHVVPLSVNLWLRWLQCIFFCTISKMMGEYLDPFHPLRAYLGLLDIANSKFGIVKFSVYMVHLLAPGVFRSVHCKLLFHVIHSYHCGLCLLWFYLFI